MMTASPSPNVSHHSIIISVPPRGADPTIGIPIGFSGIGAEQGRDGYRLNKCPATTAKVSDLCCDQGFQLANRLCRDRGQLHALWPYIRLARATSAGFEDATSQLQSVLTGLTAANRRDVLARSGVSRYRRSLRDAARIVPAAGAGLVAADRHPA
jgi:hypothetical protein